MTEKARLASIGLGWWGNTLAEAVNRSDTAQIVSCFARTESTRKVFSEKHGCRQAKSLEEILKDNEVQGIIAATPHSHHSEIISKAASAGKHIFIEKPFTLTVAEAKKAIEDAKRANVVLQIGHQRRRLGANRRIREMIDRGELGILHQFEANISAPMVPKPGWRSLIAENPVGALTPLGVHMIDTLHYFAGPIKRLFCLSKRIKGHSDLDDTSVVAVEFKSGPIGYIGFSSVLPQICTIAAYGTEAAVWSEENGAKLYLQKASEQRRSDIPVQAVDSLADEMAEFARCIQGLAKPETGGAEGLAVVAAMEAIIKSSKTGKPVDISGL